MMPSGSPPPRPTAAAGAGRSTRRWVAIVSMATCTCILAGCSGLGGGSDGRGGDGETADSTTTTSGTDSITSTGCAADQTQACKCILGASVYGDIDGCSPHGCDSPAHGLKEFIDGCARKAKRPDAMCGEITNLVQCARDTGCTNEVVTQSCHHVKELHPDCQVDCGSAPRKAGLGLMPVLVAFLAARCGLWA